MVEKVAAIEQEIVQLKTDFQAFRLEAKTERAALATQISTMDTRLSGLIQQRDAEEKEEMLSTVAGQKVEIEKLKAEIQRRTFLTSLQKVNPVLETFLKFVGAGLILWAVFKFAVSRT